LQRYGDLTVFKIAAVRHLGFLKFNFLTVRAVAHIAIFVIFKMAAAAMLDFQKFEILTVIPLYVASVRHHSKFRQNASNGCRDMAI